MNKTIWLHSKKFSTTIFIGIDYFHPNWLLLLSNVTRSQLCSARANDIDDNMDLVSLIMTTDNQRLWNYFCREKKIQIDASGFAGWVLIDLIWWIWNAIEFMTNSRKIGFSMDFNDVFVGKHQHFVVIFLIQNFIFWFQLKNISRKKQPVFQINFRSKWNQMMATANLYSFRFESSIHISLWFSIEIMKTDHVYQFSKWFIFYRFFAFVLTLY